MGAERARGRVEDLKLHHPTTDTWTPVAPPPNRMPPDGRVLVASQDFDPPQIYNPNTGTWVAARTSPMGTTVHSGSFESVALQRKK